MATEFAAEQKERFQRFLLDTTKGFDYLSAISSLGKQADRENETGGAARLEVKIHDLDRYQPGLAALVMRFPAKYVPPFEEALKLVVAEENQKLYQELLRRQKALRVALVGQFGRQHVTPRGLNSAMINRLCLVRGIVTKYTDARPKLLTSIHFCPRTGVVTDKVHRDATSLAPQTAVPGFVQRLDEDGNELNFEWGLSEYKDTQKFTIQEMPEHAPSGALPRYVDVIAEDDLVHKVKPGDRVEITGVYRTLVGSQPNASGVFNTVLISNCVRQLGEDIKQAELKPADIEAIRSIASKPDAFELLSRSIAPTIFGHEEVKKGLLLLLFGGAEKNLENGTHLRGDINILLIGDPSCGKSQLLRFMLAVSPHAVSTTGRGASGVGLTAAVTRDELTKERRLEAGAMVLGDRGIVCIDEFDKMSTADRTAIHEVMEQQTVTIAKAGIHTRLNARCSVVAAANPIYGNWDDSLPLSKNVNLPDSLLSRFDLVFPIRDLGSMERDRKISQLVMEPMTKRMQTDSGTDILRNFVHTSVIEPDVKAAEAQEAPTTVFSTSHSVRDEAGRILQVVTSDFLRKYVRYAKARPEPKLSDEAIEVMARKYSELRQHVQASQNKEAEQSVTTRALEAIIRLGTAHARLKLNTQIEVSDILAACELMWKSRNVPFDNETGLPDATPAGDDDEGGQPPSKKRRRAAGLSRERRDEISVAVGNALQNDGLSVDELLSPVNEALSEELSLEELGAALAELESLQRVSSDGSRWYLLG
mmetsp:Transcript_2751/g.6258  ORF Transcript_2751/g.6258 Transcript_2751/m.6258 type:complete len:761 (-) Transcript_2751:165-2447(-)|eukprot:CAMPEP_0204266916 /NCGR_PEP_ID=MMETSP0468-20130131/10622_1 /ASSEMBLY_ACC=CAM_ASM_000383 /TAXON_ID=2969 /ORGANISM="Oxyrrhis marina" /LENGTH=760 /DNA_ID=CAMNT_0051242033 /DNA_START=56 /DNA_END=2338 /DNA_ORIENTATION=+